MSQTRQRLLARVAPPEDEPLSLAEAKSYLRVDSSADDAVITAMLSAVREHAEQYLRRSLMPQSWKLVYDDYLPQEVLLPMGPVITVTHVKLIALDGSPTLVSDAVYRLNAARTSLLIDEVLFASQVEIAYEAGYEDAGTIPAPLKQGMLAHLAELYDGKNLGTVLPDAARALYAPYRELRL